LSLDFSMLDAGTADDEDKDLGRKVPGVATGRVINLLDPQGLGRVQVQLPFIDSIDLQPWARIATLSAGAFYGSYFVPQVGEDVLLAFEHGDVRVPYVIGSLWNAFPARPPLPSPLTQQRLLRTPLGNQIVLGDVPPMITIQTGPTPPVPIPSPPSPVGPYQTITLSPTGISAAGTTVSLIAGTSMITVGPEGITLIAGSSVVSLGADGIKLASLGDVMATGAKSVQLIGSMVRINS
jgi:hypothetical protein